MIVSFRDKRTRDFAGGKYVKAFSGFSRQAELKLDQLDAATTLKDLAALPGNHLERLKGDRVWVCVRHTEVRAVARDGRLHKNQLPAKLVRVVARPHGVLVEFAGGMAVAMQREEYERFPRDTEWLVEFPVEGLRIL